MISKRRIIKEKQHAIIWKTSNFVIWTPTVLYWIFGL